MLQNYLLIALRNFQRQRLFVVMNMAGLGLGLASAILIFLYVSDELRYDRMHPDYRNTYRLGITFINRNGEAFDNTVAPGFWVKQLRDTRTEVVRATRIDYIGYPTSLHNKEADKIILTEEIKWAEPGFDEILDFHLIRGNQKKMFENHNSMVVSEAGARRLFGDVDPIGQVVSVKHNWATQGREIDVEITGVFRELPANSHFKAKYILNVNAFRAVIPNFDNYMEGTRFGNSANDRIEFFESYIVVKPGTDMAPIEKDLQRYADDLVKSDSSFAASGGKIRPMLRKVTDLHFDEKNLWENDSTRGDKTSLMMFGAVAVLILVIACINYMNLATARSARRAREVGLRKSLGSERSQIAKQFFYESFIMTVGSGVIAFGLVALVLVPFNQLAHKSFTIVSLFDPIIVAIAATLILGMSLLSGSYPAIYLSGFRPTEVLKGQVVKGRGADLFRKTLVTLQYTISLVLVIATIVVIRQMEHLQHTKLNDQGSQLLSIRYGGNAPQEKFEAFRQAVLRDKDIEHVTMANHLPRLDYFGWIGVRFKFPGIQEKELEWNQLNVDFDFPKTYQLEFVAGRDFDAGSPGDSASIIINEAAVKALHQPIEKIIGAPVTELGFDHGPPDRYYKIIGVVKDFPFRSMHQAIEPLALNPHVHEIDRIAYVKLPPGNFREKVQYVEKCWKEVMPNVAFDYWFLSDEFSRMYLMEGRVSSLAKVFAVLAIAITVLGVFGLASYTAEQKIKEVGIRKVMGASVGQVVRMFIWVFLKIFLVAGVIAVPMAYKVTDYWLQGFVYRAPVTVWVFGFSLIGLLGITVLTVGYETWKAARANPVNSLRTE